MNKAQRYILGLLCLVAVIGCMAASLVANLTFVWRMVQTTWDWWALSAASVGSDLLKAAMPMFFFYFISKKRVWADRR